MTTEWIPGRRWLAPAAAVLAGMAAGIAPAATISSFTAGDLVISTVVSPTGADNSAGTIVLQQFALSANGQTATGAGSLALPQAASGKNLAISGEYGSSSEGFLQLSADGHYLTMMGYGVSASAFNTGGAAVYGDTALAQSTSVQGGAYTAVPRVVALIGADASVDTSTGLYDIYDTNNPRSAATVDGQSFYLSGQGAKKGGPDEGIFYAQLGATSATAIDTSTDTRFVSIQNTGSGNTLTVSRDWSKSKDNTNVDTLTASGGGLPTSASGVTEAVLAPGAASATGGNAASIDVTAATENGVNDSRLGKFVYLSPEEYFFADPSTLYIADSGAPKNGSAGAAALGAGGLQKWSLLNGIWTLDYILSQGLNLVDNETGGNATGDPGVTGLFGLTGRVVGGQVQLFATSYGLNDMSQSYLYAITDDLAQTDFAQVTGESFTTLFAAPGNTAIRGVSFAPTAAVPLPATAVLLLGAFAGLGTLRRKPRAS